MSDSVTGSEASKHLTWLLAGDDVHPEDARRTVLAIQREERKRVVAILRDYDCAAMTDESLLALLEDE